MPAPIILGAAKAAAFLASLLPLLLKGGKSAAKIGKAAYDSKQFWPVAIGGTLLGSEALGQVGKAGERGLAREEIALQKLMGEAAAEATKRGTKESRENTEKYLKEIVKAKEAEATRAREDNLMQAFMESQNRQMAMTMQVLQGVTARPSSGAGSMGLLRSNI
jgi:hypothetical protein